MGLRDRYLFQDKNCFFVTTTFRNHLPLLKTRKYNTILANSIEFLNKKYFAEVLAYVFMPTHIHMILYFKGKNSLSDYMRDFKKFTAFQIRKQIEAEGKLSLLDSLRFKNAEQQFKIWMDRFDDVYLENPKILEIKLDYIHLNPVKSNLCPDPTDYKYSSACYYFTGTQNNFPVEVVHYKKYF